MKVNIFKCLTLSLLLCSIQLLYAGRIYDEFEDIYKITWIGNSKLISGTTDDWAQRAGDIYRLKIDDPSNYSFLVYELPENEIAHEVIVDYYSPTGLRPTLAVKNSAGEETKYVEGWDNGYPEITDKGHGLYRCTLKDSLIPEDATQVVIYLDAQSDIELLRNIVYYGDGYQAKNYNEKTNYYRVQKLLEKAESGSLPAPLYSNILEDAFYLSETDITPVQTGVWTAGGSIWDFGTGKGWRSEIANSELQFKINGDIAAVTYWKRPANENFGTAQIWVDDNPAVVIDGSNGEHIDQIVLTDLGIGEHILHIKLLENKKFEIVCIAVSGERSYWNGRYYLENVANNLRLTISNNDITMNPNGTGFNVSHTDDGYIAFNENNSYLSVNAATGALELSSNLDTASKFLYIDKGEKAVIRALANGKYLSQKDNIITASTSDIADNEYFLFKNEGDPTTINELRNNEIDCSVVSNQIIIKNAIGEQVNIFDLSGKLLYRQNISTNNENIYFNNGNYLIQIGDKTFKCNI